VEGRGGEGKEEKEKGEEKREDEKGERNRGMHSSTKRDKRPCSSGLSVFHAWMWNGIILILYSTFNVYQILPSCFKVRNYTAAVLTRYSVFSRACK